MTGLFFYVFSVIVSKSVKECPAKAVALEIDPQKTQKTQNAPKGARRNLIRKRHKRRCSVSASLAPRGEPPARWLGLPPDGGGAVGTGAASRRGHRRSLSPRGVLRTPSLALPPDGGGAVGTGAALRRGRRRVFLSFRAGRLRLRRWLFCPTAGSPSGQAPLRGAGVVGCS